MAQPKKYHISKKLGEPRQCRAKTKPCPLGGAESHFGTEEAAREYYEKVQSGGSFAEPLPPKSQWVGGHYNGERDVVDGRPGRWSTQVLRGFGSTSRATFFPDDAGLQDDPADIPLSLTGDEWKSVNREHLRHGNLAGLEDAQRDFLEYENNEGQYARPYGHLYDGPIAEHVDEFVKRGFLGEKSKLDPEIYDRNFKQISPREKLFYALTEPENSISGNNNVLHAALIFPEKDLFPVLEKLGVENVTVSSLKNTRETGLVYTVMTPTGSTRSFSLFERRNYDSLAITGLENWDVEEKPYGPYPVDHQGRDSSSNIFAEFSYDTSKRQVAETMGYFLKSAQEGTLDSDQDLVAKAEHLDWNKILSDQIPGFGDWLNDQNAKRPIDLDKSFSRWEEELGS